MIRGSNVEQRGEAKIETAAGLVIPAGVPLRGGAHHYYHVECWRRGRLMWVDDFENALVNNGRAYALQKTVKGQSVGAAINSADVLDATKYADGKRVVRHRVDTTAYQIGDMIQPAVGNAGEGHVYICTAAGTSAGSGGPAFGTTAGGNTTDGTVTWTEASCWFVGLKGAGSIADADTMGSHGGWTELTPYSNTTRVTYVPGAITISGGNTATCDNVGGVSVFNINGSATVAGMFLTDRPGKGGTIGLLYGVGDFTGGARAVQDQDTLNLTLTTTFA